MIKSQVSYSGHRRLVNCRCPAYGHPRFTGRRCPSVKFPVLKVKISTFAAVSPPGSSSWLILRHLRLICSTYLVFGEVWTTAKSKIIQRLKVLECTLKFKWPLTYFWKWLSYLPYLPQGASEPDNWTPAIYWSLVSQSQSRQNISISISSSQDPRQTVCTTA